ncbi:cache domain-containing protein [Methanoregula sp.]|uniref:cache domain-containing protein n=1 Tax=Methanoregula sp. TaxID=2052170 RepID=UPI0035639F61
MKAYPCAVILLILATFLVLAGCTAPASSPETADMKSVATELTLSINNGLGELKAGLKNTSDNLSVSGLSGTNADTVLAENLRHYPWAYSSVVISRDGIVKTLVPKNTVVQPGLNLSGRVQVDDANTARAPLVGRAFRMEEGWPAISQSYPVVSSSGEYLGFLDITYPPETFLGRYIEPVMNRTGYDVCVVQADGTEIYDTTREEIGKNILSDPVYADSSVKDISARITKEPSGSGKYTFWDRDWNRNVTKTAVWETAGIDGAVWRVVVTSAKTDSNANISPAATSAQPATDARQKNLTRFVERAVAYADGHGKDAAVAEFNNKTGPFIDGDLYVFAYERNGTVIALPYQQGLLGTNRIAITDSNGVRFIERQTEVAREGGGTVYYIYPNPSDNFRDEFKVSYTQPVDSGWFVGSGIYLPEIPARFNTSERDELVGRVKQAAEYARVHGATKAIADFNDKNGTFADGSRYIFAYGTNGTTLALPFQPEVIGTNRMNFTDSHGVKVTAWECSVAKSGGGFVYVEYLNPDTGKAGLKLCYVVPVDETWFVGSGIYTDRM